MSHHRNQPSLSGPRRVSGARRVSGVRHRLGGILALLLVVVLTQCESGTQPPSGEPGALTIRLVSPEGAEGGFLVALPSADVTGVEEGDGIRRVIAREHDGTTYVAVTHRFGIEDLSFELYVTDTSAPPEPTLMQVVDRDDVRRVLDGYALEVVS